MQELIQIITNEQGQQLVSARELYEGLEIKTKFKDWFPRMLEYGFEEGKDFSSFLSESTGGRPSKEYVITLDMAKEISMLQRSDLGRKFRRYFIECEKQLQKVQTKQLPSTYVEALERLLEAEKEKERQKLLLEEQKPKVESYDKFMDSDGLYTVTSVAKMLGVAPRKELFPLLRENKYIYKKVNRATELGIEKGLCLKVNKNGFEMLKVTPKGVENIKKLLEG